MLIELPIQVEDIPQQRPEWKDRLGCRYDQYCIKGQPFGFVSNVLIVLREAEEFRGLFQYNPDTNKVMVVRTPPFRWRVPCPIDDCFLTLLLAWFQENWIYTSKRI